MSTSKKKSKKLSSKTNLKNLEIPLNNAFRRALVKQDGNRLVYVYYVTPNGQYLKDMSDVCDWLEKENKSDIFSRVNFNFVAKKLTSHESEFIIEYDLLPEEIKTGIIQKKKSTAPIIVTVDNDYPLLTPAEVESNLSKNPLDVEDNNVSVIRKICITTNIVSNDENISEEKIDFPAEQESSTMSKVESDISKKGVKEADNFTSEIRGLNVILRKKNVDHFVIEDESNISKKEETVYSQKQEYKLFPRNENDEPVSVAPTTVSEGQSKKSRKRVKMKSLNMPETTRYSAILRKKSIASSICTVEKDDLLATRPDHVMEVESTISTREVKMEEDLSSENVSGNMLTRKRSIAPRIITMDKDEHQQQCVIGTVKIEPDPPIKRLRLEDAPIETDDNSMTLSVESSYKDDGDVNDNGNIIMKPKHSFDYPLVDLNSNGLIEIGTHCHIDRFQEVMNGEADGRLLKQMKSYCGNQCAFDCKGYPRVAFECDVCLVMWHNDCSGYRVMTVASSTLFICDNCYLLHASLNVTVPNTFCNIDALLQSEFKPELNVQLNTVAIPMKLEAIFKLCKIHWILQTVKKPNQYSAELKAQKKLTISKDFPKDCRYFIKAYIRQDSIVRDKLKEECIMLPFTLKDMERMAFIFADLKCELIMNEQKHGVYISKIIVKTGELLVPVSGRISKHGYALFYTYEYGQDKDRDYVNRCDKLQTMMANSLLVSTTSFSSSKPNILIHKEPLAIVYNQSVETRNIDLTKNIVSRVASVPRVVGGTLPSKYTVVPSNRLIVSSSSSIIPHTFPSVYSQNLPKNLIPISRTQIQKISNLIKIRKRKQDFSGQKVSLMVTDLPKIQYHNLVDLPFAILEQILLSSTLSTVDKLNCRLANRVLKCVVDAGRVWAKLIINPSLVTGLLTMFDFFSQRNVKKITFTIDFQESFGIEFFNSFIGRLKLYPDAFHLEKMTVKLFGFGQLSNRFSLPLQDILSVNKSLTTLSISTDVRSAISTGKSLYLSSESLETLKLKNIDNIFNVMRTKEELTPKLKRVRCGDWSRVLSIDIMSLTHITSLRMDFTEYVYFSDVTDFSLLTNLERLVISRPRINDTLKNLLGHILNSKSLQYFLLETEVTTKDQLSSCHLLGLYFPPYITQIYWNIFLGPYFSLPEQGIQKIVDYMPINVRVTVRGG